ncbi:hypothetical protein [Streptomyces sp. NPDC004589]|uniref:MmyB family transcriptional regulator n=1 Tax=Streptomyces sp. NPDC004589 TaxID=3154553 RepID=UPI0033B0D118
MPPPRGPGRAARPPTVRRSGRRAPGRGGAPRRSSRSGVAPRASGSSVLGHPQVGPMELSHEKPAVTGTDGQVLVLFHADPGTGAARPSPCSRI